MKKLYTKELRNCQECPNKTQSPYGSRWRKFCSDKRRVIYDDFRFPDWCPLKDVKDEA